MRLKRFAPSSSCTVGWQLIASDELYVCEKCTLDGARQPHVSPLFRIRTRSTPSLVTATGMTLNEILHDWNSLCGFDRSSFKPDCGTTSYTGPSPRLSPEQIATFVQAGAAISTVQFALEGTGRNVFGLVLLLYAYGRGVADVLLLLWLAFCILKNWNSAPIAEVIARTHHHNLNQSAQVAGKCSTVLEALTAAITTRTPFLFRASTLLVMALGASLWLLGPDAAWWCGALRPYRPVGIALLLYTMGIWALGLIAPHVVPTLGWPDPLHFFFSGIDAAPVPPAHCSLNWAAAIPIAALDWCSLWASQVADEAAAEAEQSAAQSTASAAAAAKAEAAESSGPPPGAASDALEDLLAEADRLANTGREARQGLIVLSRADSLYPDTAEVLWRFARAYDELFMNEKNAQEKESLAKKASDVTARAVQLDPQNAAAHRWRGIALGRSVDFMGVKEKVATGATVRESFEKALQLAPDAGYSLFCMGSWFLAVAELSWVERKAAKMIFNDFPENPYQDALNLFARAETLEDPKFVVPVQNLVSLAKCYIALKIPDKAREALKKAVEITSVRPDELQAKETVAKMLRSL